MGESTTGKSSIKLRRLEITNFKAIDHLVLAFPQPDMAADPDVFVMGSKNGLGKTSVLEACAVLTSAFFRDKEEANLSFETHEIEPLVRAGADESILRGSFSVGRREYDVDVVMHRIGDVRISRNPFCFLTPLDQFLNNFQKCIFSISGGPVEPIALLGSLYFHSHRKVREGSLEASSLLANGGGVKNQSGSKGVVSTFKLHVLRAMMEQANLFEGLDNKQSKDILVKLNDLVKRYAGGTIEKLRTASDNTVEFLISPTQGGKSFAFDGLSSGQKEIISTLFLIWYYTHDKPGIVLIDEPELHLNAEWHRDFVQQVFKLVPDNQYIIATHSEDVFASVAEDRRLLLVPSPRGGA
ncbi:MAG: AAA family ATPase [Magnetococcus sp. YQC-3]